MKEPAPRTIAARAPKPGRGESTRRQVLEATVRLLAREGPRGVTHRAVAAEAGTSLRATTYYFASRSELLREALVHYTTTASARFARIAQPIDPAGREPVDIAAELLARTVLSDLQDDRVGLVAEYELVLEIAREPGMETTYRAWQQELESLLAGYAALLGSQYPARDARLVLATLRGLEMEALARPSSPPDRDELEALFRALFGGLTRPAETAAP